MDDQREPHQPLGRLGTAGCSGEWLGIRALDETGVVVEFEGGSVTARHGVVAVPRTLAGRLRYVPALPALRAGPTQQMPEGSVIKFPVGHGTPFWRQEGLHGFVLNLDDEFDLILDNSPHDASCGVLVGFLAAVVEVDPLDGDEPGLPLALGGEALLVGGAASWRRRGCGRCGA